MSTWREFNLMMAEMDRQQTLKREGKFTHTAEDLVRREHQLLITDTVSSGAEIMDDLHDIGVYVRWCNDNGKATAFTVLMEEVVEVAEAIFHKEPLEKIEEELVQVGAVAASVIRGIDWERHRVGTGI